MDPGGRPQADIAAADSYSPGDPVWVYRGGSWRPGVVLGASPVAAMVRYRPTEDRGTAVDTVTAVNLLGRTDDDQVDHPAATRAGLTLRLRGPEQAAAG